MTLKITPSDIDLVSFVDSKIAADKKNELKNFIYPKSMELYGVDGYVVISYSESEKNYANMLADRSYWIEHFGKTKPVRNRKGIHKGFLEIII